MDQVLIFTLNSDILCWLNKSSPDIMISIKPSQSFLSIQQIQEPLAHLTGTTRFASKSALLASWIPKFFIFIGTLFSYYLVLQNKYIQIHIAEAFRKRFYTFNCSPSTTTISPLSTSLINFAPTISRAHVSEANINEFF